MFLSFFPATWMSSLCVLLSALVALSFILQMSGIEYGKDKKF